MKTIKTYLTIAISLFLAGCNVPSLNALLDNETTVFNEEILGVWKGDHERWKFKQLDSVLYEVTIQSNGDKTKVIGRTGEIKGQLYLDLSNASITKDLDRMTNLPVHSFFSINITDNQLSIQGLDDNKLKEAIAAKTVNIDHSMGQNDEILLTAPTKELQAFVHGHGDLFGEKRTFYKN